MSLPSIFLPPASALQVDEQLVVHWSDGQQTQQLPFASALALCQGAWRLVLPAEQVTACAVQLPTQKARWLRRALPFAVEEILAEDVEQMHLALGPVLNDGRHRVMAVRRSWLEAWLVLCGQQRPQQIVVDADLLPEQGHQLLHLDGRWLLGGEASSRLALNHDSLISLVAGLSEPVLRADQSMTVAEQAAEQLEQPYAWLAQQTATVDVAQAEFAAQSSANHWQRWRVPVAVVGFCVALQWLFLLGQGLYLQAQAEHYQQLSETLYRELFPADVRLVNIRAQFDQHLASSTQAGSSYALQLMDQASPVLLSEGAALQIQQLEFSDAAGDLRLQIQANDFSTLERLRERLEEQGMAVELGSATRDAAGVSATVLIRG